MGLDNFCDLFTDEMFLLAVKNTLRHMIVTVPMPSLGAMILVAVMILPLLGRAGMQFLLGEEKIWNKCGEFFRRRRKELDEFTGYVVGALQPIVLAVYRVLCPHLFCKFSDDLKGML